MNIEKLLSSDIIEKLETLFHHASIHYWIGVDIGATNTRISLATDQEHLQLCRFVSGSTRHQLAQFESLAAELSPFVRAQPASGAALAGAGRILKRGEVIDITNFKGGPEHRLLSRAELPQLLFPLQQTVFLNDLQAASYGVLSLALTGKLSGYFTPLWGRNVDLHTDLAPYLIVAPGTGLGASLLLWVAEVGQYIAMPLEAGHTHCPPLGPDHEDYASEKELLDFVSKKCWAGKSSAEFEDLVCGQGLVNIYLWLCSKQAKPASEQQSLSSLQQSACSFKSLHPPQQCIDDLNAQTIVDLAFAEPPNPVAAEALYLHYRIMARFSANLAICTQVAGVFWAGSNQVLNDAFIRKRSSQLQHDWFQHSKAQWLEDVPVLGQVQDVNVNILGTILIAQRQTPSQTQINSSL